MSGVSLFSGIGGLCEGVRLAGFDVTHAVEIDKYASHNYEINFPEVSLYHGDVSQFENDIKMRNIDRIDKIVSNLDIVFGGPPCQGFSQIGPRDPLDPRNELYLQLLKIAYTTSPKFILIENVPNMFSMRKGLFKDRILTAIRDIGYTNIAFRVLNSAEFGVPQSRKRIFIIASRDISYPLDFAFDVAISLLRRRTVSVDEAISDLPADVVDSGSLESYPSSSNLSDFQKEMRIDFDGKYYSSEEKRDKYARLAQSETLSLHNHHTKNIQSKRLELIKLLKPGAKADSLPREIWDNARPEKWRRLHGDRPSHTLLAQMHRDMSEWVHPHYNRWISVREAMRIQSFNDSFILETSEWQMLKQIGNSVPPLLGLVPATALKYALAMDTGGQQEYEIKGQLPLF